MAPLGSLPARFRSVVVLFCLAWAPAAAAQTTSVGLSSVRAQRFGNDNLSGYFTPQPSDRFAWSLAAGDFNGDGADDLATGMPFDDGFAASPVADSGSVVVRYSVRGSGLTTNPSQVYFRQRGDVPEPGDEYGSSLASCDFNGDGFADLAVGVPREDYLGKDDAGVVHVLYGSSSGLPPAEDSFFAQSTPGVPEDVETGDRLGHSLTCGDFDGDGFDDLAVGSPTESWDAGAPCYLPPYNFTCDVALGNVFVVPGSAFGLAYGSTIHLGQDGPGMIDEAESADLFGWALAAGDFDGDGFDDLAIGVPGEEGEGAIQVVFGGPAGPESTSNVLLHQDQAGGGGTSFQDDKFGSTLAAGDFDGDGIADLAVGAPLKDGSSVNDCGQATVIYGALGGFDLGRTLVLTEETVFGAGTSEGNDYFGYALAGGDFNRDGFDDLAIGHPNETVVGAGDGAVTVLTGFAGGISLARRRQLLGGFQGIPGNLTQSGERFGHALASGDFDGDGHADLAIGSPYEDVGGIADVGSQAVLYGALFADGVESGDTDLWSQALSSPFGNNIGASTAAKLGPSSSNLGLQVDLYDPRPPLQSGTATFVRVGPEAGFVNERALGGQFFVNPQNLTMSSAAGANILQMMAFARNVQGTGTQAVLAFDLVRTPTNWSILANYRNDSTNALQFAGSGVIADADPNDPSLRNVRIEFEWAAGSPGRLTMWRTRFVNGVPDAAGRVLLFANDLPSAQSGVVNQVFVGMVFGQDRGTFGSLYLDELSFRRGVAGAAAPPRR